MKKAVVIVNLHSGMKRKKKEDLENFLKIFDKFDYQVEVFKNRLINGGLNATIRRTLGSDISASCGQLRSKARQEMNV